MNKNKKIIIVTGIFPPDIGGPATFSEILLRYLANKNIKVQVISLANIKQIYEIKNNIILIKRSLPKFLRILLVTYFINRLIKPFDSIISCGLILETYLASFGKKTTKKIYRFVGDSIWEKYLSKKIKNRKFNIDNNSLKINLLISFRNFLLNSFNLIITPSSFLKDYLINKNSIEKNKIIIINNFVINQKKIEVIKPKTKSKLNLVCISRLVPWKNIDILIKSVKNLDFIHLDIVGDGPEYRNLIEILKSEKIKNVSLLGKKDKISTLKTLNESDCFIQISSYEGMSFSILEAIKLNKPMILSNIKPNFETAKSAAIYVNYQSQESIINAICLVRSIEIRKQLFNCSKNINKKFYIAEDSLEKYKNLLLL